MDVEGFLVEYPEFEGDDPVMIGAFLDRALGELNPKVWSNLDHAQGLLAAHYLVLSPSGRMARLDAGKPGKDGKLRTVYSTQFDELLSASTCLIRNFP